MRVKTTASDEGDVISPRARPALFEALPSLAPHVAWTPLAQLPTPVESCDPLAPWLGRGGVHVKRDDLVSPAYGGNKIRRFEFLLADARARGARTIVTAGGIASTQVQATAIFGRMLGFAVSAVLFDQPVTHFAREAILVSLAAGAKLVHGGGYAATAARTFGAFRRADRPYLILPGAAGPLANIGYVDAMLELAAQVERGEAPRPDAIVLPTGSSGTLAALAIGAAWLGWPTEIVGVRITSRLACNALTISAIIEATRRFLEDRDPRFHLRRPPRWSLDHGAIGPGYGHPTTEAIEGAAQLAALTGAAGEVTYTGKALAALRRLGRAPRFAGKTLLLWNTLSTARPAIPEGTRAEVPRDLEWVFERAPVA